MKGTASPEVEKYIPSKSVRNLPQHFLASENSNISRAIILWKQGYVLGNEHGKVSFRWNTSSITLITPAVVQRVYLKENYGLGFHVKSILLNYFQSDSLSSYGNYYIISSTRHQHGFITSDEVMFRSEPGRSGQILTILELKYGKGSYEVFLRPVRCDHNSFRLLYDDPADVQRKHF